MLKIILLPAPPIPGLCRHSMLTAHLADIVEGLGLV